MKKLLSVIICFAVLASSLALFPSAAAEFTMDDAKSLVESLAEYGRIFSCGNVGEFYIDKDGNVSNPPMDTALALLRSIEPDYEWEEHMVEGHVRNAIGEYSSPEYWRNKLTKILTDEYVDENFGKIFDEGIAYYDGKVYVRCGVVGQNHISEESFDDFEDKNLTVNGDTAQLTCLYELPFQFGKTKIKFEFKYTEAGWRISGGTGTNGYFGVLPTSLGMSDNEAQALVSKLYNFKQIITDIDGDIFLENLPGKIVTDKELIKRLDEKRLGYQQADGQIINYKLLDGDYGKLSYWKDYLKTFLTDDFVENNIVLKHGLIELDGLVYAAEEISYRVLHNGPFFSAAPLENCVIGVGPNIVIFSAEVSPGVDKKLNIKCEYTEDGWRICGGDDADIFIRWALDDNAKNPETGDSAIGVTVCLLLSAAGLCIMLGKRRFLNA